MIDPLFTNEPDIEESVVHGDAELVFRKSVNGSLEDESAYAMADAVLNCRSAHLLPRETIRKLSRCRVIQQGGVGYGHVDLRAAAEQGILVMNTPDYGTTEVADHAVALALNLLRGVQAYDRRLRRSNDSWDARSLKSVRRLPGLRVGIIGLGRIGTAAALRFKAFGMNVAFYDPYLPVGQQLALGLTRMESLEALLRHSEVLSIHAALNTETDRMLNEATLAMLPAGAVLINTARGNIVDFAALKAALFSGHLSCAGLDVFETEPLDREDPLVRAWIDGEEWLDERLIMTPHAAFYSTSSLVDIRQFSITYLMDFLRQGKIRSCVNQRELDAVARENDLRRAAATAA
ncbi:MAG: C-terminal binding protein [Janthinobacterium lividum]